MEKLKKTVGRSFGSREALDTILTAAQHGHAGYIRKLIEQGVDVDLKNKEGNGALHFAARYYTLYFILFCFKNSRLFNAQNKRYSIFRAY